MGADWRRRARRRQRPRRADGAERGHRLAGAPDPPPADRRPSYVAAGTARLPPDRAVALRRAGLGPRARPCWPTPTTWPTPPPTCSTTSCSGGVLSATFIPVFVDRLANRYEGEAFESISAVVTVSLVVLLGATRRRARCRALPHRRRSPPSIRPRDPGHIQPVTTNGRSPPTLLRWFVIQIAAYGFFGLGAALLNTRRRFVAVAWAPIVNNLVCIAVLIWFGLWPGAAPPSPALEQHHTQLVLLGLGTSLGVVSRPSALVPSLRGRRTRPAALALGPRRRRRSAPWCAWAAGHSASSGQPDRPVRRHRSWPAASAARTPCPPTPTPTPSSRCPTASSPSSIMSRGHAGPGREVVGGDLAALPPPADRRPARRAGLIIPSAVGMLCWPTGGRPAARARGEHAGRDGDHRRGAGHVRARAAGLLHLPLRRPGAPVDAAHQGGLLLLPARERASTWRWPWSLCIPSVCAVWPCHCRSPTPSPPSSGLPSSAGGSGAWATARTWAPLRRVVMATVAMGVVVLVVSNLSGSTTQRVGLAVRVVGAVVAGLAAFAGVAVVLAAGRRARGRPAPARHGPGRRRLPWRLTSGTTGPSRACPRRLPRQTPLHGRRPNRDRQRL